MNSINLYQVLTHLYIADLTVGFEHFCKVTAWIITPSTSPFSCRCAGSIANHSKSVFFLQSLCSFVELLCEEGGTQEATPAWFCSHWQVHPWSMAWHEAMICRWGEPVFSFIKAVETHADARGLGDESTVWVCACKFSRAFNRKLTGRFDCVLRR